MKKFRAPYENGTLYFNGMEISVRNWHIEVEDNIAKILKNRGMLSEYTEVIDAPVAIQRKINNKVLFIRNGGIGDVLMTTPLIKEYKKNNSKLDLYYETLFPELLVGNSSVNVLDGNKVVNRDDFGKVIDLNRVVETKKVGAGLLDEYTAENNNRIDLFFDHLKVKRIKNPKIEYYIKDSEVKDAKFLLKNKGVKNDDILIGYAGFAVANRRCYPLENAKGLFKILLKDSKIKIILFGRKGGNFVDGDEKILKEICKYDRVISFIDETTIRESAAIMNECKLMVTCDSGLLHIINALNLVNVALFGTIKPWVRTRYYPYCNVISAEKKIDCSPCNDRADICKNQDWSRIEKYHTLGGECMWKISSKEVGNMVFSCLRKCKNIKRISGVIIKDVKSKNVVHNNGDIDAIINNLILPKDEWKVYFPIASMERNHYAGGLVYIWQIIHGLLANNMHVVVVTNCEPLVDRDFKGYEKRDKLHFIIDKDCGLKITKKSFCFDFVVGMQPCGKIALDIAKRFDVPSYLWLFDPLNYAKKYREIKYHIKREWEDYGKILGGADYIITTTKLLKKWTEKWIKCDPRKVLQIYPCINSVEADKVNIIEKKDEVTFLGRITTSKHPEQVFDVLGGIDKKYLINFIGFIDKESGLENIFKEKSKKTGIKYKIYEGITDKEKFGILARSKLFIYPSHYEGYGIPPLEANYMGIDSVVYDLESYKEWAKGVFGIAKIGNNNIRNLNNTVKKAIEEPRKIKSLKEFGSFDRLVNDVKKIVPPFRPSVIMEVYNEEEYIEYAIRSVYDWAWEIIIIEAVVEDMYKVTKSVLSTDKTSKIIENFIRHNDKEKKIIYKRQAKPFKSKIGLQNEALKCVTGNILFKLDGDEVYKKKHLRFLKEAFIKDPSLDLIYFTTLNFWTSFKLITKGMSWDAPHFKICRYKKDMKYTDGHSQMRDNEHVEVVWQRNKYKTIFMPEVVNYHFGWCKSLRNIQNKLKYVKNRSKDKYDNTVHDTYAKWKHGMFSNPYENGSGLVYPYFGKLPKVLKNHSYKKLGDVREVK